MNCYLEYHNYWILNFVVIFLFRILCLPVDDHRRTVHGFERVVLSNHRRQRRRRTTNRTARLNIRHDGTYIHKHTKHTRSRGLKWTATIFFFSIARFSSHRFVFDNSN